LYCLFYFFFSSRRRHTSSKRDWSSDVCSSDLLRFSYFFYVCAHVETMIPFFDEEEVTFSWKTWSNFVLYHIRLVYLFKRSLSSVSLLIRKDNSRCKILPFNPFPLA